MNGEVKFFENSKKNWGGGGLGRRVRLRRGGQGRCKRISGFVKIQKKFFGRGRGRVGRGGGVGGLGQGRCERRIEILVKIKKKKKFGGGGVGLGVIRLRGGGVRVDVNREVKFL